MKHTRTPLIALLLVPLAMWEARLAQNEEEEICPQLQSPLHVPVVGRVGRMVSALRQYGIKVGSGRNHSDKPMLVGPLHALALIGCDQFHRRVLDHVGGHFEDALDRQ